MSQTVETSELWGWTSWSPPAGAEIVALIRQLDGAITGPAWVEGYGEVQDPVVLTRSEVGGRFERRLTGTWDLVSFRGSPTGDLVALLARDSAAGPQQIGGLLASARFVSGALRVGTALTNRAANPVQAADAPTPAPAPVTPTRVAAAPVTPSSPVSTPAEVEHVAPTLSEPAPAPAPLRAPDIGAALIAGLNSGANPSMPKRPAARDTSVEQYPEEGDIVTHFAFGRCLVLYSDGERLRLQQERDSRVREVAISMLKVQEPTLLDTGKRHWDLARKH